MCRIRNYLLQFEEIRSTLDFVCLIENSVLGGNVNLLTYVKEFVKPDFRFTKRQIHIAINSNNIMMIKRLFRLFKLHNPGTKINKANSLIRRCIHIGNLDILQWVVKKTRRACNQNNLKQAAVYGHEHIYQYLIQNGCTYDPCIEEILNNQLEVKSIQDNLSQSKQDSTKLIKRLYPEENNIN